MTILSTLFFTAAVLLPSDTAGAQPPDEVQDHRITQANFKLAGQWTVEKQLPRIEHIWTVPYWLPNEDKFVYKRMMDDKVEHILVDASKKTKEKFFDRKILAEMKRSSRQAHSAEKNRSPDGKYKVRIHGFNLRIEDLQATDGASIPITEDGEEHYLISSECFWSPDSRYLAFLREDWRKVKDLWLVNPLSNPRPTLKTYKWPIPGEEIEQYSLCIFDCSKRETIRIEAEKWPDQTLAQLKWSPDSSRLFFTRMSRDWMSLDLCAADPVTKKCEILVEERNHRQIITRPPFHVLSGTGEILWWSMRNNWGHFYLYTKEGKLNARVTKGAFHSGKVVQIDEEERVLYFMGNAREEGRNPYFHHLYRVNLDGTSLKLLTPEEAEHEIYMAGSCRYFLDNYSCPDLEPQAVVRDSSGELVLKLEAADISDLKKAGWKNPEIFKAKAADNETDLWGVLYKPFDFDPDKKYPIISYGYPGKEGEVIPWKFYYNSWVTLISVSLAQYGFVVAVYGNRGGTPERSYDYYDFGWDDLRDYPVADKKAVIEQLAAQYDYIDIDRVGITGASSGGFMAATAILAEPDFFKVAVSRAGNHDNNLYWHHWNERYGSVTREVDDTGKSRFLSHTPTNNEIASNLKGRLLLVQGDMDLHVPPSLTLRLANDLIEANKRFDQFIIPGCDHFFGKNWQYLIRYIELYFVENLMGDDRWSAEIFKEIE